MSESRPWLKNYPSGIPANINADEYPTVVDYFKNRCQEYNKRKAFSSMGKEISYRQLDELSTRFAAYLQSRGLQPGDKMAIMLPNLLQYPIAIFGCLKAGLIVVNTNPLYTSREMEHQFTDSDVKAILILENFAANLEKILSNTDIKTIIITSIGEMLGLKGGMVNFVVRNFKRMVPKYELPNPVTFSDALEQGKKFEIQPFESGPDTVVVHQYTGGTTGISKGAMLTNRNLVANMLQIRSFLIPFLEGKDQIILAPLPLYHIFAFTVNCMATIDIGALSVLVVNPRDLSTVVKEFKRYKISCMTGVNTLYNALLNYKPFRESDWSHLTFVAAGGMALQKNVAEEWTQLTGQMISEGYGLTETSPVVTFNPKGKARLGTVGIPLPSTDVRIRDENGTILPLGQEGEIQVKGPQVMKGYYNQVKETQEALSEDGWLNTGDIGVLDDDGYLKIVDRKKDIIIVSGFNVYPNEIENVVTSHPKVLEAGAVGIPNEHSGEVVKVYVVKKDKSLKEKELIEHCRHNLTGYKVPKEIEFCKELPKTNVGKILRRKLKE